MIFTGSSGLRTASDRALRKVARIRCLVDRLITRWLRTEARTWGSADSRHSMMRTLSASMESNIASTWREVCFVPGVMEALKPGKDERHASTEEIPRPLPQGANPRPSRPHAPDTGAAPRTNVAVAYAAAFVTSGNSDSQTSSVGRGRAPPLIRHHRHARPRSLSEPDDAIAQHGRYRPYVRRCDRSAAEYPAVRTPRPGRSADAGGPSERSQRLLRYGRGTAAVHQSPGWFPGTVR